MAFIIKQKILPETVAVYQLCKRRRMLNADIRTSGNLGRISSVHIYLHSDQCLTKQE